MGFPTLTPPNSKYIPKQCLFRHEAIMLRGRWSEESVRRYCIHHAKKQGYNHVILDIEYIYNDGTGDSLTVQL
ncbi:MAG: hypothetical protein HXL32_05310 [Prevotellaceae bacterium]|nr:hypothetical protein [Prevotellaceae bacterium]